MKTMLTWLFAILWALDTLITIVFVNQHDVHMEGNPVVAWVIANLGFAGFVIFKASILGWWLTVAKHAHIAIHLFFCIVTAAAVLAGTIVALGILI